MTIEEGCELLASRWHCHDDFRGLLSALQEMGAVKFDAPNRRELLNQASQCLEVAKAIEKDGIHDVPYSYFAEVCKLIGALSDELQKAGEK